MNPVHLALANLIICAGIFWACVCRLNTEYSKTLRSVRARYAVLLSGALVMGLQPTLFGTWPSGADMVFSGVVLAFLVLSAQRWKQ